MVVCFLRPGVVTGAFFLHKPMIYRIFEDNQIGFMKSSLTPKGEKAIELIDQFPTAYTRTLARILYKKYPTLYIDVEDARKTIRNHRGEGGATSKQTIRGKTDQKLKYQVELPKSWTKKKRNERDCKKSRKI